MSGRLCRRGPGRPTGSPRVPSAMMERSTRERFSSWPAPSGSPPTTQNFFDPHCDRLYIATMLTIAPSTITAAREYVNLHHRHHRAPQGGLFACAVTDGMDTVGVAIVGRPVARGLVDGYTCEVTRVAVREGYPNACSMLYGACWRAARALGYRRMVTYTLASEDGTACRAVGMRRAADVKGRSWSCPARPRLAETHPLVDKVRWELLVEPGGATARP